MEAWRKWTKEMNERKNEEWKMWMKKEWGKNEERNRKEKLKTNKVNEGKQ